MKPPAAPIWSTSAATSFEGTMWMSLTFCGKWDFGPARRPLKSFAARPVSGIPPPSVTGRHRGGRWGLARRLPDGRVRRLLGASGSSHANFDLCGRRQVRELLWEDGRHRRGDSLLVVRERQAKGGGGGRGRLRGREEGARGGLHQPLARELPRAHRLR